MTARQLAPDKAAADYYRVARSAGVERHWAVDLALANLRAAYPNASEIELRTILVGALARGCIDEE